MEVIIQPSAGAAADLVAQIIAGELRTNPRTVLGLATGGTMESVYARLVRLHKEEALDFSGCRTFNLDEYVGLPGDHPNSYRHYMNHHLFRKVNIDPRNTYLPDGMAPDLEAEGADYERLIAQAGGIDLQLLGIGRNGHMGFNEPLSAFRSRTRVATLTPETIRQNAPLFGGPEHMPRRAITMGVGTILDGRRCVLLATGLDKAAILAQAIEGPFTCMISATALQLHPHCAVIADESAGGRLEKSDYYRTIFMTDPKWEKFRQPAGQANGRARPSLMQMAGN